MPSSPRANQHPPKSVPILIVEGNDDYRCLIANSLRDKVPTARPYFVADGLQARDYLHATQTGKDFPSLVLLDIYIPGPQPDWSFLQYVCTTYPALPVVILSDSTNKGDIVKAYEQGAHSFIAKPTTPQQWNNHFDAFNTYWMNTVQLPNRL